jgi:hypothetical protein
MGVFKTEVEFQGNRYFALRATKSSSPGELEKFCSFLDIPVGISLTIFPRKWRGK